MSASAHDHPIPATPTAMSQPRSTTEPSEEGDPVALEAERGDHESADLESLVHEGDVVMLTTQHLGHLTSRPLTVAAVGGSTLLFLVDADSDWVVHLDPAAEVNASISTRRNDWVSITGPATVSADAEAIMQLWSPAAGAYFEGADDARIRVLQLTMEFGEYWSAPGHGPLGRLVAVVSSALGVESMAGEHGSIG